MTYSCTERPVERLNNGLRACPWLPFWKVSRSRLVKRRSTPSFRRLVGGSSGGPWPRATGGGVCRSVQGPARDRLSTMIHRRDGANEVARCGGEQGAPGAGCKERLPQAGSRQSGWGTDRRARIGRGRDPLCRSGERGSAAAPFRARLTARLLSPPRLYSSWSLYLS
jgi:hypothetical protein